MRSGPFLILYAPPLDGLLCVNEVFPASSIWIDFRICRFNVF